MTDVFPYVTPRSMLSGQAASDAVSQSLAWPLGAGASALAFSIIEISIPKKSLVQSILMSRPEYERDGVGFDERAAQEVDARLEHLMRPNPTFAGLDLRQPVLMGIVNVTPDSFSDGGRFLDSGRALCHALSLREEGAEIIDIGGESTRPGASPVEPDDEIARVIPLVRKLASEGVCVSIDTRHAKVMRAAIDAGARIVNDVTALEGDPESLNVIAEAGVPVILMHMRGKPQTMQDEPVYGWAPGDVFDYLSSRVEACVRAGVKPSQIAVDPGIGFGKNLTHNAEIMNHLGLFIGLGLPLVFGASRKSFIGQLSGGAAVDKRLPGSIAAALHAVGHGAHILRVHDVAGTQQALKVVKHLA